LWIEIQFKQVDKNNSKNNYLNAINRNLELINNNYNKRFRNIYNDTNSKSNEIENYTPEDPSYVASISSKNKVAKIKYF